MVLKPLGDAFNGTNEVRLRGTILGGVLISADSTNDATVLIKNKDDGETIFSIVVKQPMFACAPMKCHSVLTATASGTGAKVQLFEWFD